MKLNLFGRTFAALMRSLSWGYRWASPINAAGSWIQPIVSRPNHHSKARARPSHNRQRYQHGRA